MEYKTILNVPWVQQASYSRNRIAKEDDAYSKVPLIFRAIRLRMNSLARVPVYVYEDNSKKPIEGGYIFEEDMPMHDLLVLSEAAILLKGASYVVKLQNPAGFKKGLQWLNPFSIITEINNGELRFYQQLDHIRYPANGYWYEEDMIYMRDFHPSDDLAAGISATQVALGNARISQSVTQFIGDFFTADALPITMVTTPKGTAPTENERVQNWFRDKLSKAAAAVARVLAVSGDVKIERLTDNMKDQTFDKIDAHTIQEIAWAFDIPKTILTSDSANFATAGTEYRSFIDYTIVPRCRFYERQLNPFLEEFGQRIEFCPDELPEMQEDEKERAGSLKALIDSGIPLDAALDILGYDLSEKAEASITASLEESRKLKEKLASQPIAQPDDEDKDQKEDLDKWMRKSLKKLKEGKPANVDFESDKIPAELKTSILKKLSDVRTEEDIRLIFSNGRD